MQTAAVEDSDGRGRITLDVDGPVVTVEATFCSQWLSPEDPLDSTVRVRIEHTAETLNDLRHHLRAHLTQPLHALADNPFSGRYELHDANGSAIFNFGSTPPNKISRHGAGGSYLVVELSGSHARAEVGMFVDITTLDTFVAQLDDLRL